MQKIGLFVLLLVVSSALAVPLVKFTAQETSQYGARCLDGTSAGYYLYKTSNAAYVNNWVFYLQGGGWCFANSTYPNVENCYNRINNALGSSKSWPATMNVGFFRDYNYVYIKYCSGDFHSGTRNNSVGGLYYAGHLIVQAVITKLKQIDTLSQAKLVLLTGSSAGGLGVIVNFDYMKTQFPNAAFKAWPSAGWFPEDITPIPSNYISMIGSFKRLYSQVSPYLNQACKVAYTSEPHEPLSNYRWRCYSGSKVFPYIGNQPFFVSQSIFDSWAQGFNGVSDLTSPNNVKFESHFGQAMRNSFAAALQAPSTVGLFLITDNTHEFGSGTVLNGVTLQTIASNWIDGTGVTKDVSNCTFVSCSTAPYKGCFVDTATRDLPFRSTVSGAMTVELCQSSCKASGYQYAGVQYSSECWCGNAYGRYGADLSGCTMTCAGAANEFCGQGWHNDVYSVLFIFLF